MIVNLSGGLDSTTLLFLALDTMPSEPIQPISFSYGQKHKKELDCARIIAAQARVKFGTRVAPLMKFSLPLISSSSALTDPDQQIPLLKDVVGHPQPPTYVPFRNLIFTSYSLHLAEALHHKQIGLGIHKSDMYGYWDTSAEFVLAVETLSSLNRGWKVRLWCPFLSRSKADIVRLGLKLRVPYQHTWSCYNGQEKPCRVCATCREREAAFESNKVVDPLLEENS